GAPEFAPPDPEIGEFPGKTGGCSGPALTLSPPLGGRPIVSIPASSARHPLNRPKRPRQAPPSQPPAPAAAGSPCSAASRTAPGAENARDAPTASAARS